MPLTSDGIAAWHALTSVSSSAVAAAAAARKAAGSGLAEEDSCFEEEEEVKIIGQMNRHQKGTNQQAQ